MKSPRSRAQTEESRFSLTGFLAGLKDWHILLAILVVHLVLALLLFDPKLATGGDNAQYIILAKSILQGKYNNLHEPGAPIHVLYPPGFPLLIAPALAVSGSSFIPMKLVVLLCSLGTIAFMALFLKRVLPDRSWIMPVLLTATCPLILDYSHWLFSEVPFLFFSALTLYLFQRALSIEKNRLLNVGIAAVSLGATYYIRSQGLFLIGAMCLVLLFRRRWRELAVLVVVVGAIALPWFIRNQSVAHGGYLPWFLTKDPYNIEAGRLTLADVLQRFITNVKLYVLQVYPSTVLPVISPRAGSLLAICGVVLSALTAFGLVRFVFQRKLGALEWYTLFSVAVVLLWPSVWSGDRFLLPVVPFLLYYLYWALADLGRRIGFRQLGVLSAAAIVLLFGVTNAGRATVNVANLKQYFQGDRFAGYDDAWRTYFESASWLRDHTEPGSIVVSRKPQFTYLYSGRQSFVFPYTSDENKVLSALDSLGATHVALDNLEGFFTQSMRYMYPVIRDHPERFQQIGFVGSQYSGVVMYTVKR